MENIQITHECVKEVQNIGSITYHNICNGYKETIPWGAGTWFTAIFMISMFTGIGIIFYKGFKTL